MNSVKENSKSGITLIMEEIRDELVKAHGYDEAEAASTAYAYCSVSGSKPFAFHRSAKRIADDLARVDKLAKDI